MQSYAYELTGQALAGQRQSAGTRSTAASVRINRCMRTRLDRNRSLEARDLLDSATQCGGACSRARREEMGPGSRHSYDTANDPTRDDAQRPRSAVVLERSCLLESGVRSA